jgi:hypothetical protein
MVGLLFYALLVTKPPVAYIGGPAAAQTEGLGSVRDQVIGPARAVAVSLIPRLRATDKPWITS